MQEFDLEGREFITLDNLLKVEGWCESGGLAKQLIAAGQVMVDGEIETRKRKKISNGQIVEFDGQKIKITATS